MPSHCLSPCIQQHVSGQTYCSSWKGLRHCRSTRLCSTQSSKHPPQTGKHALRGTLQWWPISAHHPPLGHFLSSGPPQQRCSVIWNLICSFAILTSHLHRLKTVKERELCLDAAKKGMENIPERPWSCKMKMEWPFGVAYSTWKMFPVFLTHFSVCLFTLVCVWAGLWGHKRERVSKES